MCPSYTMGVQATPTFLIRTLKLYEYLNLIISHTTKWKKVKSMNFFPVTKAHLEKISSYFDE